MLANLSVNTVFHFFHYMLASPQTKKFFWFSLLKVQKFVYYHPYTQIFLHVHLIRGVMPSL